MCIREVLAQKPALLTFISPQWVSFFGGGLNKNISLQQWGTPRWRRCRQLRWLPLCHGWWSWFSGVCGYDPPGTTTHTVRNALGRSCPFICVAGFTCDWYNRENPGKRDVGTCLESSPLGARHSLRLGFATVLSSFSSCLEGDKQKFSEMTYDTSTW